MPCLCLEHIFLHSSLDPVRFLERSRDSAPCSVDFSPNTETMSWIITINNQGSKSSKLGPNWLRSELGPPTSNRLLNPLPL